MAEFCVIIIMLMFLLPVIIFSIACVSPQAFNDLIKVLIERIKRK